MRNLHDSLSVKIPNSVAKETYTVVTYHSFRMNWDSRKSYFLGKWTEQMSHYIRFTNTAINKGAEQEGSYGAEFTS